MSALTLLKGSSLVCLAPMVPAKPRSSVFWQGLSKATEGRVLVHGHDVQTDYVQARRMLGVVPQELVFDPFFSVREKHCVFSRAILVCKRTTPG